MTDRELLELAAKAMQAAEDPNFRNYTVLMDGSSVCLELGHRRGAITAYWSPLTDDGDALRLAVKLKIDVAHTNVHAPQVHALADSKVQEWEDSSNDPYAATRRAIVRAAAEVGKGKA